MAIEKSALSHSDSRHFVQTEFLARWLVCLTVMAPIRRTKHYDYSMLEPRDGMADGIEITPEMIEADEDVLAQRNLGYGHFRTDCMGGL
jgi:hypothetical protein